MLNLKSRVVFVLQVLDKFLGVLFSWLCAFFTIHHSKGCHRAKVTFELTHT